MRLSRGTEVCVAASPTACFLSVGIQQRPQVARHTFCCLVFPNVYFGGLWHVFDGVLWVTLFCQVVILYTAVIMCIIRVYHCRQQCSCQVLVIYLAYDSLTEPTSPSHRVCCSIAKESHMILLIGCFQICSVRTTAGLYHGCQGSMPMWSSLRTPLKRVSMAKFMRLDIPCCVFWETLGAVSWIEVGDSIAFPFEGNEYNY